MIKSNNSILTLLLVLIFLAVSCSQRDKKDVTTEKGESEMSNDMHGQAAEHDGHMSEDAKHHHDMGSMQMSDGENMTWNPGNGSDYKMTNDFHFIIGSEENIKPRVIQSDSGDKILQLTANGSPSAFVFHQAYGNVGMATSVDVKGFEGTLKLIHHAENADNYEFVSINAGNMKLGRIVNGKENVLDKGNFEAGDEWINLRLSAAGTHFKGYIGNETITHGHGDKMKDGYVGIMLDGTGIVSIKSLGIVKLEDE